MKCSIIFSAVALVAGTLAADAQLNVHELQDLAARSIDPQTMDPTGLSVLSVLKTAMPSGVDVAEPTGSVEPDWYKDLPENIKSLLPILYPHVTSIVTSSVAAETSVCSFESAHPNASDIASSTTVTSYVTVHHTFQPSSTAEPMAPVNSTASVVASVNSTASTTFLTNVTIPTASPTPSGYFSTGARTAIRTETLAAIAWLGLGAGFVLFA